MSDCIEYKGSMNGKGYGLFRSKGSNHMAHKISFKLFNPSVRITPNRVICHKCDNRKCINPEHLFIGTHADNVRDRVQKGRSSCGVDRPCAKLNPQKVIEIREYIERGYTNKELGRMYGVDPATIMSIKKGLTWKHI